MRMKNETKMRSHAKPCKFQGFRDTLIGPSDSDMVSLITY
jgi:hypothetical protein